VHSRFLFHEAYDLPEVLSDERLSTGERRADEALAPALEALGIARAAGNPTLVARYEALVDELENR